MEINPLQSKNIKIKGRSTPATSKPPGFGRDSVQISGNREMNLVSGEKLKKLFAPTRATWTHEWDKKPHRKSFLLSKDGNLYTGDYKELYCLDRKTGKVKWKKKFERELDSFPGVVGIDNTLYVCTTDSHIRAIDPKNGNEKWSFDMKVRGGTPKIGPDGSLYAQYKDDLCILKPNGRKKWTYRINEYMQRVVEIDGNGASYVATKDKGVFAFSPRGKKLWNHPGKSVFTGDDDVYVAGENSVLRVDPKTGNELWEKNVGEYWVGRSKCGKVVLHRYGRITCLDRDNGNTIWKNETNGSHYVRYLSDEGVAIVGSDEGEIYALDPGNGNRIWTHKCRAEAQYGNACLREDGILFISDNKTIYGLDIKTGNSKFSYSPGGDIEQFDMDEGKESLIIEEKDTFNIQLVECKSVDETAREIMDDSGKSDDTVKKIDKGEKFVDIGGVRLPIQGT
ncbi:MAG: PQQ-binding-like beta-propeller repeat protein [Candidatus Eremiobacteraeota bacterium]|nr:PQQ-binding-like beta-propeller repeat protein [Candidatus Eremiobacteraeota bacterium]